jgi:hypothetical protein
MSLRQKPQNRSKLGSLRLVERTLEGRVSAANDRQRPRGLGASGRLITMLRVKLARALGVNPGHIDRLSETASHRYKFFVIEKKNGGGRPIYHPAKQLKAAQRWLQEHVTPRCRSTHRRLPIVLG